MALFHDLAQLAETLATDASRLSKRAAIAAAITRLAATSVPDAGLFCAFLASQPFAEADPRKLNVGGALLTRALLNVSSATEAALTAAYRRHGDLGAAAFDLLLPTHAALQPTLTLEAIEASFAAIATARTTAIRTTHVEGLLRAATPIEVKFLLKLVLGDMRIGVKQALIEDAIAVAAQVEPAAVRHAVMLEADLPRAVARAFAGTLAQARMTLFHPLGFMLASPVDTPEEAVARFTAKPEKPAKPAKKPRKRKADREPSQSSSDAAEEGYAANIEQLSGISLDEARIHYNSPKPTALAYATGAAIHLAPGQPAHLPHEAWHVVQQAEGRVAPTLQLPATSLNEDPALEQEADILGTRALAIPSAPLAFLEDKYDGMRAQIHCGDPTQPGRVAIYSRNREDVTHSFPELAEAFAHITDPLILDGEILGWDFTTGHALPFAIMGQRIGRKLVPDDVRRAIPVLFMAFDVLFANADLLLPLPLHARRAQLETIVARWAPTTTSPYAKPTLTAAQSTLFAAPTTTEADAPLPRFQLSPSQPVGDAAAIDQAYRDARDRKNEGVMLKAATSAYLPGRRGLAWVKLKRELATLDVVITGAEFGSGKRSQFLSDYTFAVRGPTGDLLNIGKAYSGVTDAEIAELTLWLKDHTLEDHGHFRTVEPLRIIEVAFNNIMRSTRHASGFALRFPRIIRLRDDKPLAEIDTLARAEEIYQSQPDRPHEDGPTAA